MGLRPDAEPLGEVSDPMLPRKTSQRDFKRPGRTATGRMSPEELLPDGLDG
jgi:hypothetical protein